MSAGAGRESRSRGAVTAEFAVLMPGLSILLAAVLAAGAAAQGQLRCVDAAGVAARLAARHEPPSVVAAAARAAGPAGAQVVVERIGDRVRVVVRAKVPLPLPGGLSLSVRAESVARREASAALHGESLARREASAALPDGRQAGADRL